MKLLMVFLSSMFFLSSSLSLAGNSVYYEELKALKEAPETKELFNKEADPVLSTIRRDIIIFQKLTSWQRFVRTLFLAQDVIVVTGENMPKLYTYIEEICEKAEIAMPTVFITRQKGFFNAFAQKLLMSTGGIIVG